MEYVIEVSDTRKNKNQGMSLHLMTGFGMLGVGAFTFLMANADWVKQLFHNSVIPIFLLTSLCLGYGLLALYFSFFKSTWLKKKPQIRIMHSIFGFAICVIMLASQWWLAAGISGLIALANVYAYFLEKKRLEPTLVRITNEYIYLPQSARRKQLKWTEVDRLILKHGNITIDLVDNYLYQWPIKVVDGDIKEIESFCAANILIGLKNRKVNNW